MRSGKRAKPRRIETWAGRHAGDDVWVIGAGASLGYYPPGFFDGRVTIAVNHVAGMMRTTYACTTVADCVRRAVKTRRPWIVPETVAGIAARGKLRKKAGVKWVVGRSVRVETPDDVRSVTLGPGDLIVGPTSILTAIHAAAIMGARAVFVVGLDGGAIDGAWRVDGYRAGYYAAHPERRTCDIHNVPTWMACVRALRDRLARDYGCQVVGATPFLGIGCEWHAFDTA